MMHFRITNALGALETVDWKHDVPSSCPLVGQAGHLENKSYCSHSDETYHNVFFFINLRKSCKRLQPVARILSLDNAGDGYKLTPGS